jgi:hypothetical protein
MLEQVERQIRLFLAGGAAGAVVGTLLALIS